MADPTGNILFILIILHKSYAGINLQQAEEKGAALVAWVEKTTEPLFLQHTLLSHG